VINDCCCSLTACNKPTVSLLDSLDSTLDNEQKPPALVQRTSGDMHTIPELTGERGTASRTHSEDVGSADHSSFAVRNGPVAVDGARRLSNTLPGLTLLKDTRAGSFDSVGDVASKTASGQLVMRAVLEKFLKSYFIAQLTSN